MFVSICCLFVGLLIVDDLSSFGKCYIIFWQLMVLGGTGISCGQITFSILQTLFVTTGKDGRSRIKDI